MSRAATGDVVTVKPANNIYTVLVIAAVVVQIIGLVSIILRYQTLFGTNIFTS